MVDVSPKFVGILELHEQHLPQGIIRDKTSTPEFISCVTPGLPEDLQVRVSQPLQLGHLANCTRTRSVKVGLEVVPDEPYDLSPLDQRALVHAVLVEF